MTRAEKHTRNLTIRDEYIKGLSAKEIAERYSLSEVTIYGICKGLTDWNNKGYAEILRNNSAEVIELLKRGVSKKEVAEKFNVTRGAVVEFSKKHDLNGDPLKNSEEDAARKIRDKSNGLLEYVSGYTIKEKPVRVRCVVCGGEFERTFHNLTTKGGVTCPHCVEQERVRRREIKTAEQERKRAERERKAIERKAEEERKRVSRIHSCPVCGTITDRPKYCSERCAKKVANTYGELRRRNLIKSAMVDKDITVDGLYRRDKGRCMICGGLCDWDDYTVRNGRKICGDWYPSIDHIIPLAKGGLHSWDNVQLAHRRCNWEKSDEV